MPKERSRLAAAAHGANIPAMKRPTIMDFGHLTPAERMELAEQLWDSLADIDTPLTEPQVNELRRRRAALAADTDGGVPWEPLLDEIERHGG